MVGCATWTPLSPVGQACPWLSCHLLGWRGGVCVYVGGGGRSLLLFPASRPHRPVLLLATLYVKLQTLRRLFQSFILSQCDSGFGRSIGPWAGNVSLSPF